MKREEVLSWLCSILGELLYTREFFQELVEKVDQQVFVILFTKQLLEAEAGERVQICGRLH